VLFGRRPSAGDEDPGNRSRNIERRWRTIRKSADLEWVTPHIFRKTVASLISERVDADTASQQLGHSSPSITREF
jgi:integrase